MENKIKILHIVSNLKKLSGVSSYLINLVRNSDEDIQYDFLVCKREGDSYEDELVKYGAKIYYIDNPLSLSLIKAYFESKKFFKEHSTLYDIIELHSPSLAEFTVKFAKKNGCRIIISHSHSTISSKNKIKRIVNFFLLLRIKYLCNVYWACSMDAAKYLYGKKIYLKKKYEVINNAIDTAKYNFTCSRRNEIRHSLNLSNEILITHVSNFEPIKNIEFLVDVIANVCKQKNKKYKFLFIGDGPERHKIEQKLEQCVSFVTFLGRKSNVFDYLQASDLFLLPSFKEGLPFVLVEAQATGLPCFASTGVPSESNIVDVKFLPLSNIKWIEEIINFNPLSDNERENKSNYFKLTKYNIQNEAKRVCELYRKLKQNSV